VKRPDGTPINPPSTPYSEEEYQDTRNLLKLLAKLALQKADYMHEDFTDTWAYDFTPTSCCDQLPISCNCERDWDFDDLYDTTSYEDKDKTKKNEDDQ
jgi:hypothetical protein